MEYIIKPGDNLTSIGKQFGLNWQDIWKNNPSIKNPNLIYAGNKLIIPDTTKQPTESLKGTLPTKTPSATPIQSPAPSPTSPIKQPNLQSVPTASTALQTNDNVDNLTAVKILLREMNKMALKQGMGEGLKTTMTGLQETTGFAPEKVSGSMIDRIVSFTESQVGNNLKGTMEGMADIVESLSTQKKDMETKQNLLRDDARQQMNLAISSGMWNQMDPDQQQKLWEAAGYTGKPIAAKEKATSEDKLTESDKKIGYKNSMAAQLKKYAGPDGYVSPQKWRYFKQYWTENTPFDGKEFVELFKSYANPNHLQDYDGATEEISL